VVVALQASAFGCFLRYRPSAVEWLLRCRPPRSDAFCDTGHLRLSGCCVAGLRVRMLFTIHPTIIGDIATWDFKSTFPKVFLNTSAFRLRALSSPRAHLATAKLEGRWHTGQKAIRDPRVFQAPVVDIGKISWPAHGPAVPAPL